jgi:hypothetical protein
VGLDFRHSRRCFATWSCELGGLSARLLFPNALALRSCGWRGDGGRHGT